MSKVVRHVETAALYARVSTKDGGQDTENQLIQLRAYCAKQGWTLVHEYVDHVSGKRSDNRRQFQEMLADAARRKFDLVAVWALDRFSREGVMETFEHIKMLKGYGVEFESFTERHFRTTGPAGELMIAIAAWIAAQERTRISERTLAGLARARKAGRVGGRPRARVDAAKVVEMRAAGASYGSIATALNAKKATVYRIANGHAA